MAGKAHPSPTADLQHRLAETSRRDHPYEWAALQNELGAALLSDPAGDRSENVEAALRCFRQAAGSLRRQGHRRLAALAAGNVALALRARMHGVRAKHIEEARRILLRAVKEATSGPDDLDLLGLVHMLGTVHLDRVAGDRAKNVEAAIEILRSVRERAQQTAPADFLAQVDNNLALAYRSRIAGDPVDNQEIALSLLSEAVHLASEAGDGSLLGDIEKNLGMVYSERITGSWGDNVEESIRHLQRAEAADRSSVDRADTAMKLGISLAPLVRRPHGESGSGHVLPRRGQADPRALSEVGGKGRTQDRR